MNEVLCPNCGNRNPAHTQFCHFCDTYLGWADDPATSHQPTVQPQPGPGGPGWPAPHSGPPRPVTTPPPGPAPPRGGGSFQYTRSGPYPPPGPHPGPPPAHQSADLRVELEQEQAVVVTPGAAPVPVTVHITNTSTVVEAYRVVAANAPPWLVVTPGQVRLYPRNDERVQVMLAITGEVLVPAQRFRVLLRIQGESNRSLYRDVVVDAVVGEVIAPAELRLEPSSVRLRDATTAQFRVIVDNRRSNVAMRFDLTGRDPEQQVRFAFHPVRLDVPPGGTAAAGLRVDAPLPPAGEQLNRTLTVLAVSGAQELSANAGLAQAASAMVVDPPVVVRLDPSVVHANRGKGVSRIIVDNRRGTRPQHIHLEARDVENVVRFQIVPQNLEVAAGGYGVATVDMRAPRPEAGEEASRSLIVTAWDGRQSIEAQGQLVQETAARRPFMRVLLTILGGIAMIVGSFLPWTFDPERTGVEWNYPIVPNFLLGRNTDVIDQILGQLGIQGLVSALVTAGGFTAFFGILAMLGLFGTGKLIRSAAVFGGIVLILFLAAAIAALFVARGFPGLAGGWFLVLAGCVLAYVGSHLARA